jgi:hypothetical protein
MSKSPMVQFNFVSHTLPNEQLMEVTGLKLGGMSQSLDVTD